MTWTGFSAGTCCFDDVDASAIVAQVKGAQVKVLVVMSDPNPDGPVAACADAARQGIVDGHSPVRIINLNDLRIQRCAMCNPDGWGTCRTKHICELDDDFQELHESVTQAQGYVFITPAYFGSIGEAMRAFLDRLRRCEATKDAALGEESVLLGKPAVGITVTPEGSSAAVTALAELASIMNQLQAVVFDLIPVTDQTQAYQLETVHDALMAMVNLPPAMSVSAASRQKAAEVRKRHAVRRRRHH